MLHPGLYEQVISHAVTDELAGSRLAADLARPETSIARSSLFTGAVHEPQTFNTLLSNTTREIKEGFITAPKGCCIQLERIAARYILGNVRASCGSTAGLVSRTASFAEDSGLELTLVNFPDYYHLDPRALYKFSTLSRIRARKNVIENFEEPLQQSIEIWHSFDKGAEIGTRGNCNAA